MLLLCSPCQAGLCRGHRQQIPLCGCATIWWLECDGQRLEIPHHLSMATVLASALNTTGFGGCIAHQPTIWGKVETQEDAAIVVPRCLHCKEDQADSNSPPRHCSISPRHNTAWKQSERPRKSSPQSSFASAQMCPPGCPARSRQLAPAALRG